MLSVANQRLSKQVGNAAHSVSNSAPKFTVYYNIVILGALNNIFHEFPPIHAFAFMCILLTPAATDVQRIRR